MMSKGGIGQNILREMKEDFHEEIPVPKIKELLNEVKTKMSKEEIRKLIWDWEIFSCEKEHISINEEVLSEYINEFLKPKEDERN